MKRHVKRESTGFNKVHLEQHMDILTRINAYQRNYENNDGIQGISTMKYRIIIGFNHLQYV